MEEKNIGWLKLTLYEEINDILKEIGNEYNMPEAKRIYQQILISLQSNMLDKRELLLDKKFYLDNQVPAEILKEFDDLIKRYNLVRNELMMLDTRSEIKIEEKSCNIEAEELDNIQNIQCELEFLAHSNEQISYLETDLYDTPEEYLEKISQMFIDFMNGIQNKVDYMSGNNKKIKGFFKLKDDQVRILMRRNGSKYIVIGAFAKKSNEATKEYTLMAQRDKKDNNIILFDSNVLSRIKNI